MIVYKWTVNELLVNNQTFPVLWTMQGFTLVLHRLYPLASRQRNQWRSPTAREWKLGPRLHRPTTKPTKNSDLSEEGFNNNCSLSTDSGKIKKVIDLRNNRASKRKKKVEGKREHSKTEGNCEKTIEAITGPCSYLGRPVSIDFSIVTHSSIEQKNTKADINLEWRQMEILQENQPLCL